jgi:hypothetical protein
MVAQLYLGLWLQNICGKFMAQLEYALARECYYRPSERSLQLSFLDFMQNRISKKSTEKLAKH